MTRGHAAAAPPSSVMNSRRLSRQCREAFGAAIGRPILNDEASSLVISEFPETIAQGVEIGVGRRGYCLQHTDAPGQLLRARRERPRNRCAAERGQQFPPSDGDCHTPLPCEVRKWNDTTPRACSLAVLGGQDAG